MTKQIEISIDVEVTAGIGFWIDRDEWEALDDSGKRGRVGAVIDAIAGDMANDTIKFQAGNLSASINGPIEDTINLTQVEVYDPEAT